MPFLTTLVFAFSHLVLLAFAHSHDAHRHLHVDKRLLVDFSNKPVDVTGVHTFHPPAAGDQRGPCPGLNALANHGYVSRDGIVSFAEAVSAINSVFGMGVDLAGILATMGIVWGGAPVSLDPRFSIGGKDRAVSNLLDGLLGVLGDPQGIENTHNLIESDSSPTRDDLYVTGDAWTMNFEKFQSMLNAVPENGDSVTTSNAMADFAAQRFQESIGENPDFYYGPFTGMIARNAGYLFIVNMFSNHSAETGDSYLTHDILMNFFGVSGSGSKMTYNKGWERIPENWYRTPVDYTLLKLNADIVSWTLRQPVLGSIGGNTGTTNSFAGVDLSDPVTGLTNVPNLLESNNLVCFALQIVKLASPTYLNNLYKTLAKPLNLIVDALNVPLLDLACPSFNALTKGGKPLWKELEQRFPGARTSAL